MNPMTRILILALITVSLGVVSYPSHAFPLNVSIDLYFDASGAFIGQHVVYCNGNQQSQGTTQSIYARVEVFDCFSGYVSGYVCQQDHTGKVNCYWNDVAPAGAGAIDVDYYLPPSLSLEASCQIVACDAATPTILPGLSGPITSP